MPFSCQIVHITMCEQHGTSKLKVTFQGLNNNTILNYPKIIEIIHFSLKLWAFIIQFLCEYQTNIMKREELDSDNLLINQPHSVFFNEKIYTLCLYAHFCSLLCAFLDAYRAEPSGISFFKNTRMYYSVFILSFFFQRMLIISTWKDKNMYTCCLESYYVE